MFSCGITVKRKGSHYFRISKLIKTINNTFIFFCLPKARCSHVITSAACLINITGLYTLIIGPYDIGYDDALSNLQLCSVSCLYFQFGVYVCMCAFIEDRLSPPEKAARMKLSWQQCFITCLGKNCTASMTDEGWINEVRENRRFLLFILIVLWIEPLPVWCEAVVCRRLKYLWQATRLTSEALLDAPRRANAMSRLAAAHSDWGSHWGAEDLRDIQLSPFISSTSPFFGFKQQTTPNTQTHFLLCSFRHVYLILLWLNHVCRSISGVMCWHVFMSMSLDCSAYLCFDVCHVELKNVYTEVYCGFVCWWVIRCDL